MRRLGFIGGGHMAEAMIRGLLPCLSARDLQLIVYDASPARCDELRKACPLTIARDNGQVLATCDWVFLAVKPQVFPSVEAELAAHYRPGTMLLSIMAGLSLERVTQKLPAATKLIRLMPNLAMAVGAGCCLLTANDKVSDDEAAAVTELLSEMAVVWPVEEKMMNGAGAITGCGPALIYTVLEGLTLGGIQAGLRADDALAMARQTMLGTALLQKQRNAHPAQLRDEVLSPAGTTVAGLRVLEAAGFRGDIMDFVGAACARGEELGGKG